MFRSRGTTIRILSQNEVAVQISTIEYDFCKCSPTLG